MPSAIKSNHELASKGLVSILVESQGATESSLEAFLVQRFPDNDCLSCVGTSLPIPESKGIPHGAVIGVDGTLLWAGNPASGAKKIEELVLAELVKVKKGWGDSDSARKMRAALYGKHDFAGAAAIVGAMAEGEERSKLQAEIDTRYAAAKKAVETFKERGEFVLAQSSAKDLAKGVAAKPDWATEVAALLADFDSDASKAELALDKKLAKIVKQVRDGKADGAPKALKALLKGEKDGKVAARATRLLSALEATLQ